MLAQKSFFKLKYLRLNSFQAATSNFVLGKSGKVWGLFSFYSSVFSGHFQSAVSFEH